MTSRQAARLLGVSEASVKRWADGGLLPALKTAGGHRRFRPEDVAAFRQQGASKGTRLRSLARLATPEGEATQLDEKLADQMFQTLVGGQAEEAASALVNFHLQGHTAARIADVVLCPALRIIGDLWQSGELSVAEEHLATRTALSGLQALRAAARPGGPSGVWPAICCSVEEDFHELPVHITALTLEAGGWEVVNLGMSTPFYALAESVARFRPRLVCVASTVFHHPDRAAREYVDFGAEVRRAGASVVLGGTGFAPEPVRRRFPADLHADTFTQLEEHAAALKSAAGGD
ncbi:MAG TPA: B12-binding domain-containing protein [Pyrinomonadaceae bacterium]|nr:B12-binding domain-containing protein [Pyrinomonadaceae bacterium]